MIGQATIRRAFSGLRVWRCSSQAKSAEQCRHRWYSRRLSCANRKFGTGKILQDFPELAETLPVLQRLALSYGARPARMPTLALLALDARLADVLRSASEPMLAQIRLAWWRDVLARPPDRWPEGEPLLSCLKCWGERSVALGALVDGWEAMTALAPLPAAELDRLASARGSAFGALAALLGEEEHQDVAARMGRNWALVDIASRLSHPEERETARRLAEAQDWGGARLSRALRPLAVLHGMAARSIRRGEGLDRMTASSLLPAVRLGLLGF